MIFTHDIAAELSRAAAELAPMQAQVFVVCDSNTAPIARQIVERAGINADIIVLAAGDDNKSIGAVQAVWEALTAGHATRGSLVVNIGGGMITDLGGFAAATYKRGIKFVNIPTTLLGAIDASVGGKTGVNFCGLKNQVGVFAQAQRVIVGTGPFATLPAEQLLSGYGEMIKHSLLKDDALVDRTLRFDPVSGDRQTLLELMRQNIAIKQEIVEADPKEKGLRKALNLGHTAAHAFESLAMERGETMAHGYAVAWGIVVDLVLSHMLYRFDSSLLHRVAGFVKTHYPAPAIGCADYDALIGYMSHDKKNSSPDAISFTLLRAPGQLEIDTIVPAEDIRVALDLMRDLLQ